ncbi:MAG: YdcF family protein [Salinibacter sp.]|uniref:YdcF family protein n=1 Tax=Salinibacter sp. TaxID=2065818 RepID=UPI002FC38D6E
MSLFIRKLLSLLVHPLSLGLLLVGVGGLVALGWRRIGLSLVLGGAVVLWGFSTPLVSDRLRGSLEARHPPTPIDSLSSAEAIVVLGGGISSPRPPRIHPDLNDAADRVWHAARLYRAGKAPLVIASGGDQPWQNPRVQEASAMEVLLRDWGVPQDSILREPRSANTYQNATRTARLMDRRGLNCVLLVTSALHMRRALAVFRSEGIEAVPAATDFQVDNRNRTLLDVLPDAGALAGSTAAVREYVGYLVYAWRGWIDRPAPVAETTEGRCVATVPVSNR